MSYRILLVALISTQLFAGLPIDWGGFFAIDTTLIDNYQRTEDTSAATTGGSAIVPRANGEASDASFQTYIFRLKPTIIVNDSATLFADLTSGYGNGGFLGQGFEQSGPGPNGTTPTKGVGNTLYNFSTYRDGLNVRELYAKFYSDTATYTVGRQPLHWGLGVIQNGGLNATDRFASVEDGIKADLVVGNFSVSPYYMKVSSGNDLDKEDDIKSTGVQALYKNSERDLSFGILYGIRKARGNNTQLQGAGINGAAPSNLGPSEVKTTDIYFEKGWGNFNFALEVPIVEGELGNVYGNGQNANYKARAFITETEYEINSSYSLQLNAGLVSGDGGNANNQFEALYLHPNYQIAHLMFRYNLHAVGQTQNQNIFDSYITNAQYFKLQGTYKTNKWTWRAALIWAKAQEIAQTGNFFQHETNQTYTFSASNAQSDDLGYEVDLDFNYEWNSNVHIVGTFGYHIVGDYYRFTNTATEAEVKNNYAGQLQAVVSF